MIVPVYILVVTLYNRAMMCLNMIMVPFLIHSLPYTSNYYKQANIGFNSIPVVTRAFKIESRMGCYGVRKLLHRIMKWREGINSFRFHDIISNRYYGGKSPTWDCTQVTSPTSQCHRLSNLCPFIDIPENGLSVIYTKYWKVETLGL